MSAGVNARPAGLRRIAVDLTHLGPAGENGGARLVATSLVREWSWLAPHTEFVLLTLDLSHDELAWLDAPNVRRMCVRSERGMSHPTTLVRDALGRFLPPVAMATLRSTYSRALRGGGRRAIARSLNVDLVFCPLTTAWSLDRGVPLVTLVHDLQHVYAPEFLRPHQRAERARQLHEVCRRADHLICFSEYVKQSLLQATNVAPARVSVIPHAVLPAAEGTVDGTETGILARLRLMPERFLLYPANFWEHKNHLLLLEALRLYLDRQPESTLALVCTGVPNSHMRSLQAHAGRLGLADRVMFPGYLPGSELASLMRSCRALIYPSRYEGFGMPLLDAMASGKPVLCSNVSSLPEVAGDAALYFDPRQAEAIAAAIDSLESHPGLASSLVERGRDRVRAFGTAAEWAARYLRIFEEVVWQRHAVGSS